MIAIRKVEAFIVDVPTIRPHVLAMATMHRQTLCFVRLTCDDGIMGIGEATTISGLAYGPESPEGIKLALDQYFAPILETCDATRPAVALALLNAHIVGNNFAKCAIETALLDARGKRLGLRHVVVHGGVIDPGLTGDQSGYAAEATPRRGTRSAEYAHLPPTTLSATTI